MFFLDLKKKVSLSSKIPWSVIQYIVFVLVYSDDFD